MMLSKSGKEQKDFKLAVPFEPAGDQPKAISQIMANLNNGEKEQILLGATGTGKTYTMAQVIAKHNKTTLILVHNKTLAGQLYSEIKEFFPENAVEFFVSYFDYYQPESYLPSSDTYIEKDAQRNSEIEKLRYSATASLLERTDVIVIASVSCIYGAGDPDIYNELRISLRVGNQIDRDELIQKLINIQYSRNDIDFARGTFRVRGDVMEIIPIWQDSVGLRIEFFGDEIERIREISTVTGEAINDLRHTVIFPASHYATTKEVLGKAMVRIREELNLQLKTLKAENKLLEAQRLEQRTRYDLEMMEEVGFCSGIENYSRHLALEEAGATPKTLFDYFPKDFLMIIDESHVSIPQIGGMFNGDQARKKNLIEHGFRLPSAIDHRPLNFGEFEKKLHQVVYVSATPGNYELERCTNKQQIAQQVIRPTGLIDPKVDIIPSLGQIDFLLGEIRQQIARNERTFVITLTIRMSEELTKHLKEQGIKVAYLHSEIKSLERLAIIRDLRLGKYDVLIGINLLREGLDVPEVSLVAILDADKEGFLRSERALVQNIGRAARNVNGHVYLFADKITPSMEKAIAETNRRREIQTAYNEEHGITPTTIRKAIHDTIQITVNMDAKGKVKLKRMGKKEHDKLIAQLEKEMTQAARELDFETAAQLRDALMELRLSKK
ncbi:excision nuclease of nucleotide excision repair [Erysipelotrichaceae bacterium]|nr:excision nuclease of nucleotide excision repair [Erysipelotrichaceae bacterium]